MVARIWIVAAGFVLAGELMGQEELFSFKGDGKKDHFGTAVAGAGDVNGDGIDDVIVGASQLDPVGPSSLPTVYGPGYARVFSGSDGTVLHSFQGSAFGDQFGCAVDGIGDVNGDGRSDVVVGACQSTAFGPDLFVLDPGYARVFSGLDGSVLFHFDAAAISQEFGHAVSAAGDVDADGVPDVIVGAPSAGFMYAGLARVFSGADGHIIHTFNGIPGQLFFLHGSGLGKSVAAAGDVNEDGFDDLLVGTDHRKIPEWPISYLGNYTAVYSGADGGELYHFVGDSDLDGFGVSVDTAFDVDLDGVPDFVVGSPFDDNVGPSTGSARVHSGDDGTVRHLINGDPAAVRFGISVAGLGDVDADGFADLAVSSRVNSSHPGLIQVFAGDNGGLLTAFTFTDSSSTSDLRVAPTGDLDGDLRPDLVIGVDGGGAGKAKVYSPAAQIGQPIAGFSFEPGDDLWGEIDLPGKKSDNDLARFSAVKGTKIGLEMTVLEGNLKPKVTLHRLKKGKPGKTLKQWKLKSTGHTQSFAFKVPSHGEFALKIKGGGDSGGSYFCQSYYSIPATFLNKSVTKVAKKTKKNQPVKATASFAAVAGSTLSAELTLLSGYSAAPVVDVLTPSGSLITSGLYQTTFDGTVIQLTGVPLMETGKYKIRVKGGEKKAMLQIDMMPSTPASNLEILLD